LGGQSETGGTGSDDEDVDLFRETVAADRIRGRFGDGRVPRFEPIQVELHRGLFLVDPVTTSRPVPESRDERPCPRSWRREMIGA
jgi:hypothetical protein